MGRAATVYQRKDKIFCHSSSQTDAGIWILSEPALVVSRDDPDAVGGMVRECLSHSRTGLPHPTDFRNLFKPILDLAGMKSVAAFSKDAKCVSIEQGDEGEVFLIPTRNGGKNEGFVPLADKIVRLAAIPDDFGKEILSAIDLCE